MARWRATDPPRPGGQSEIVKARGGTLFVDEIQRLLPQHEKDESGEAIDELDSRDLPQSAESINLSAAFAVLEYLFSNFVSDELALRSIARGATDFSYLTDLCELVEDLYDM